jgi:hypothetical protein
MICLSLFHSLLADFFDSFVRPEGSLPLGVVERFALDECDEFLGLNVAQGFD